MSLRRAQKTRSKMGRSRSDILHRDKINLQQGDIFNILAP